MFSIAFEIRKQYYQKIEPLLSSSREEDEFRRSRYYISSCIIQWAQLYVCFLPYQYIYVVGIQYLSTNKYLRCSTLFQCFWLYRIITLKNETTRVLTSKWKQYKKGFHSPHISNDTTIFACHASIWARLTHEYAHHLRLTAATHSVVIFLKLAIFCFLNDFKGTVKFVNLSLLLTSVEQKFQKILHCVYCLSCTFVLYLSLTIISNTLSSFAVETKRPLTSFLGF